MHKEGEEIHIDETEARGGSKEGVVRWVLAGGLLLAVILLSITWIIPAMTTGDVEEEGTVSGQISSMEDGSSDTDSIVTDLGDDEAKATAFGIYAAYGSLVYTTPFIGGILADKVLGFKRSTMLGAVLMAIGHLKYCLPVMLGKVTPDACAWGRSGER